jgi:hypothetical protein
VSDPEYPKWGIGPFSIAKNKQWWACFRIKTRLGWLDFMVRPLVTPTQYDKHQREAALVEKELRAIFEDAKKVLEASGITPYEDPELLRICRERIAAQKINARIRPYPPDWKRPRIGTYDFRIETVESEGEGEDEGMGNCRFGLNLTIGRLR